MSRRNRITSADYDALLQEEGWSESVLENFRFSRDRAAERERINARDAARLASMGEDRKAEELRRRWQTETLRLLRALFAMQFELQAWMARRPKPLGIERPLSRVTAAQRGMEQRLRRARKEAEEGSRFQRDWLADHAELIAAVESSTATAWK